MASPFFGVSALACGVSVCVLVGCGGAAIVEEHSLAGSPDATASATGSPEASTDSAASVRDGGQDAGDDACVDIVASSYDQSCQQRSDCIGILAGEICNGSCNVTCPSHQTAAINASGEARYEKAISGIVFGGACGCDPGNAPGCVAGLCVLCFNFYTQAGCADGGACAMQCCPISDGGQSCAQL